MNSPTSFLTTQDEKIVNGDGENIFLRGVNLGGWLMMEGYILYGRNISEKAFKRNMLRNYGRKGVADFEHKFRNNFVKEDDFKNISEMGFNCIRLPFNYKLIETGNKGFSYNESGLDYLARAVEWCERHNIYCILDMHAAPGCQNKDWHSDSDGKSLLWSNRAYRNRFFKLWEYLADKFKDKTVIAGYNVLNEPVIEKDRKILRSFYIETVKYIRGIDKKHIIFLEGNFWSQILEDIGEPFADNLSYSFHYYHPLDFTNNFQMGLRYPGLINNENWRRKRIEKDFRKYYGFSKKWHVPIFLGEFGVNLSCEGYNGALIWLEDVLELCKRYRFHWTYWTYKTIANSIFPSGLYQYLSNPPWVNRMGPIYGWESYYELWKKHKNTMTISWQAKSFTKDNSLARLLSEYARKQSF